MAVTAAVFSTAGFAAGVGYVLTSTVTGYILSSMAASMVLGALSPKPKFGGGISSGEASNRGYSVTASGSTLDHQIIYGKMRVGGARLFDHTTGGTNKFLHRVLGFAGHEIEAFDTIYINDEVATIDGSGNVTSPSRYNGHINIYTHLGAADQQADSNLVSAVSGWTAEHRLRGIAYLYCKFDFDADAFPNGLPEISAVIKGKKVYDPRSSATAWSDNPALCVRDYILSAGYGLGEAAANIDDTSVTAAANICDQFVSNPVTSIFVGGEYKIKTVGDTDFTLIGAADNNVGTVFTATSVPETGTGLVETARYTTNGAFTTAIRPGEFLTNILTSMIGSLWYAQGKWRMKAGAFTASALALDENDLRSGITVSTRHSRRDNFNEIKGTFKGDESNYQVTDFPPVTNAAFVTADNGQVTVADVELPFTDNSIEARRIARIMLEFNRQQLTIRASFGMRALALQVGDTVAISNTRFGWSGKLFQIAEWKFGLGDQLGFGVEMTLKETAASIYDEVDDGLVYERDNTTLLSPFEVPSVGISLSSELRRVRGKVMSVLLADISTANALVDQVEVQFKKSSDTNYSPLSVSSGYTGTLRAEAFGVEDGFYDVRARAINALGVRGDFNAVSNFYVDALAAPPADVTNFDGNVVGSNLFLSWTPVADLDLAHYIIRYSHLTSGAVYSEAENIAQVPVGSSSLALQNAGVGTYFIKAVDDTTSGSNSSVNTAVFVVTSIGIGDLNVVATLTENPSFAGVKSGVSINSEGYLELAEGFKFDSATGNFDDRGQDTDPVGLFDDFTGYKSSGIYYFSNDLDLGQKYTSRLTFLFTSTRFDRTANFDSATGNFDDRGDGVALFDGDPTAFSDTSVSLQLRHTDDDPTGTPTWSDWQAFSVSDITARAFEFRLVLSSTDTNVTPVVSALSATIDMQDRTTSGSDITFTGTTNITFDDPFAATPAIGLSLADLTNGDRYTITNKTRTGFTINTFTGGSASTNAVTLDYVAKGYGKELT